MNPKPTVYVVLLNWNGWRDTIACLESLYASRNVNLRAVVCDNASSDDSMAHISSWAEGLNKVVAPEHPRLSRLLGNITLPLNYKCLDRETAERGDRCDHASLVLVENGDNLGFAAGNNSGIRFALGQPDMDYVWVLNNDTIVEPDCLSNMVSRLEESSEKLVCGSMIHFFDQPEIIQAVGGNRFNRNTGSASMSEGRFTHEEEILDIKAIESELDYISGCSMLVPRDFLETVGLMSEDYFLYYEEIDWFTRAKDSYGICIAPDATLYHREGAAIGSKSLQTPASTLSDFHMFLSRLIFMRKYYRRSMVLCYLDSWVAVGKRLLRGRYSNAWVIGSVLLGKKTLAS